MSVASTSRSPAPVLAWLEDPPDARGISFASGDGWECLSWAALARQARRVAAGLVDAGVRPRDVVALVECTGPRFVATLFGTMLAGATPAPLAPPLTFEPPARYARRLGALLAAARPSHVVHGPSLADVVAPRAAAAGARHLESAALAATRGDEPRLPPPAAPALLQLSSGTSGAARGVCITAGALASNVAAIRRWLGVTRADTIASWLPLHHDMGLIGCLVVPAVAGADLRLLRTEHFVRDPLRYLRCFHAGGAQLGALPAFALAHILQRVRPAALDGLDLSGCRAIVVGAERIDPVALERCGALLERAGLRPGVLLPAYGLAEATLAVTGVAAGDRWRSVVAGATPATAQRVVGCGRPLAGVEVAIAGAPGDAPLDGAVGEIVVAADSIAAGYRGDATHTSTRVAGGVLRTGDAGFMDAGELFVIGRLGDGLKVRGRYVFAEDVEAALVAGGIPRRHCAALLGHGAGGATGVAVVEMPGDSWMRHATDVLRLHAEGVNIVVVRAPRGTIRRTTSGKPRRRELWSAFLAGLLPGDVLVQRPARAGERL